MFRQQMTKIIRSLCGAALKAALPMALLSSCGSVFDDLDPCPQGVVLRFRYDYNLEFANAFHNQVECLAVHIYDENGNFVVTKTETSDNLSRESYEMAVDLPVGKYHAVAYGGTICEESSFAHPVQPAQGSRLSDLQLKMNPEHTQKHLHDQFWGASDFTVVEGALDYVPDTVMMQKNTNHFRIILANTNYEPLDGKDFEFRITADNTHFNNDNTLRVAGNTDYTAWVKGQYSAGIADLAPALQLSDETRADGDNTYRVAYGELSTSRLLVSLQDASVQSPVLVVRHIPTDREVMSVPLIRFLLMSKSDEEGYRIAHFNGKPMTDQEYLDRQNRWNLMFFLDDNNTWVQTKIVVNDWVVRINNAEF